MKLKRRQQALAAGLLLFLFCNISARANVYATDIRLNASQNAGVILPGEKVTITYILNDDADAGVTARILSGTNVIKTNPVPGGSIGSRVGLNSVLWGGNKTKASAHVPAWHLHHVSITAASHGYDDWTSITDDDTNFYAPGPRGIDVNRNTNSSLYYGRVFAEAGCDTVAPANSEWSGILADRRGVRNSQVQRRRQSRRRGRVQHWGIDVGRWNGSQLVLQPLEDCRRCKRQGNRTSMTFPDTVLCTRSMKSSRQISRTR